MGTTPPLAAEPVNMFLVNEFLGLMLKAAEVAATTKPAAISVRSSVFRFMFGPSRKLCTLGVPLKNIVASIQRLESEY